MTPSDIPHKDRLIVALDLPSVEQAEAMVARLGDSVSFYKIGYQLVYAGGLPLVRKLSDQGKKVFIDLKLHDIGNTVARGVENIAKLGATFLTVHAYPQTMKAAAEARAGTGLKILAVTVLTSYDDSDLHDPDEQSHVYYPFVCSAMAVSSQKRWREAKSGQWHR